jgi:malonyl-CoA decarboxylase
MLDELRAAAARQRQSRALRALVKLSKQLLSEQGQMSGPAIAAVARELIETLDDVEDLGSGGLGTYFAWLARELSPDPKAVLAAAEAYAVAPGAAALEQLTRAAEPPRQELFRRINRSPGGTAALLRLRRELLKQLGSEAALPVIDNDLLHLTSSWFNPGFLRIVRVDWNSPAQLLEKLIRLEAVHAIDGWDDLRRRLQPDRRCFAFFHPQLPDEPLVFVEVALLAEMPNAIAPLIDKASTPLAGERFRVAAFYSISNCEPGLRGVSLGNFLIKGVAEQLKRELPRLKTFCTLSPMPGFAAWLIGKAPAHAGPDFAALPGLRRDAPAELAAARETLLAATGGDLSELQAASTHERLGDAGVAALLRLAAAYLGHASGTPQGDAVARFHLDNGARLERLNLRANLSPRGLRQSFGVMVNYLYDLERVESNHARFRRQDVVRSRAVASLL